jgi:hypothetical protein
MGTLRAHVVLPEKLAADIDELVGPRGRSAFLVQLAETEVRRQRLRAFLERQKNDPAWKDENHPDMADGSVAWVKRLRAENEPRWAKIEEARNKPL